MDPFERRVESALTGLPGPGDQESDRARRAALDALPAGGARGRRRVPLLVAAALVVGLAGGGALAAIGGALRDDTVVTPPRSKTPPSVPESIPGKITAPPQGAGVAALVDGKLWLATRSGLTIEGLPANAAALSPNAKFVVLGIGASLVAMAPDGRRAWSLVTPGGIVGAAWAPNPIMIAYVVVTRGSNELWLVEGNGDNPRRAVSDVAPVVPSWRPDSQAIAYVDRQGRAMVYDRTLGTVSPAGPFRCLGRRPARVTAVAFAPSGSAESRLAFITRRLEVAVSGPNTRGGSCERMRRVWRATAITWVSSADLIVATRPVPGAEGDVSTLRRFRATAGGVESGGVAALGPGTVGLDVSAATRDRVLLAVASGPVGRPARSLEVWWVRVPPERGTVPRMHSRATLLRLEGRVAHRALSYASARVAWR